MTPKTTNERSQNYRNRKKQQQPRQQPALPLGYNILSLFDHSGIWSQPYRDAGYNVHQIHLQNGDDVRLLTYKDLPHPVHGILAAPPCTHFAGSGARWWAGKGMRFCTRRWPWWMPRYGSSRSANPSGGCWKTR